MINRFEETIALKSLDQRKFLLAIFRQYLNLVTFGKLFFVGDIRSGFRTSANILIELFVMIVKGMQYLY